MRRISRLSTTAAALVVAAVAACSGSSSAPSPAATSTAPTSSSAPSASKSSPVASSADWPTYHGNSQRSGFADVAPLRAPLRTAWSHDLDGAVYAQPIVIGDIVIVATENNSVYAFMSNSGNRIWRNHLGEPIRRNALPCGNIDPLGITGTAAYDATTGWLFVVTETPAGRHDLHALDLRTGRERWHRNLDVVSGRDPRAQQQRGALLVSRGRVYVPFGGLFGDCGNYVGYVAAVSAEGGGPVLHYAVPTEREAGIWAPPGPVQDKTGVDLYVASGNGAATGGSYDGSDSVIRLSPSLHRRAFFAPSTWADDNANDLDLGSASPVVLAATGAIVIAGKRGTVYLVDNPPGGIGSDQAHLDGCAAYGGAAFTGQTVVLPCADGIRRLDVTLHHLEWRWQAAGVGGSPVIARDTVYAVDQSNGDLVVLDLATGRTRTRIHLGAVSRFATPVPAGHLVLVGTMNGIVAVQSASR